jgi:hypothetical protein
MDRFSVNLYPSDVGAAAGAMAASGAQIGKTDGGDFAELTVGRSLGDGRATRRSAIGPVKSGSGTVYQCPPSRFTGVPCTSNEATFT